MLGALFSLAPKRQVRWSAQLLPLKFFPNVLSNAVNGPDPLPSRAERLFQMKVQVVQVRSNFSANDLGLAAGCQFPPLKHVEFDCFGKCKNWIQNKGPNMTYTL